MKYGTVVRNEKKNKSFVFFPKGGGIMRLRLGSRRLVNLLPLAQRTKTLKGGVLRYISHLFPIFSATLTLPHPRKTTDI